MPPSESGRRPAARFFLSVSRGGEIRTAALPSALVWALAALAPLSIAVILFGAADLLSQGRLTGAPGAAAIESSWRDRLDEARRQADEAASRQLIAENALQGRLRDLAARQDRLERRGAIVAALAAEVAPSPAAALGAIEAPGAKTPSPPNVGSARAYAPAGASAAPGINPPDLSLRDPTFAPRLAAVAANPELEPAARLDLVGRSLDRLEGGQMVALEAIDRKASRASEREAAIVASAGLDPMKLAEPKPLANAGGPFIPLDAGAGAPAFDRAAARVARDVSFAERLKAAMPFVPLRKPLSGEAGLTSPFGYRLDPFLGRPALHPGVDLLQPYGAEIRATAAGRVAHAGPMGGYGGMVEIDHGFGLATRYGHMSEILVSEGQQVAQGDLLGRLGSTGRSTGPHLHYEVRVDGEPVDPERFMLAGARLGEGE